MSIALGLRPATSGTITVLGLDPTKDAARLRSVVGYGPERNVLPEDMPASDFVKHLAEVRGMPKSEARGRASDALCSSDSAKNASGHSAPCRPVSASR